MKGVKTDIYHFGQAFNFFKFHLKKKMRMEKRVLLSCKFVEKLVKMADRIQMNGLTLNMYLYIEGSRHLL